MPFYDVNEMPGEFVEMGHATMKTVAGEKRIIQGQSKGGKTNERRPAFNRRETEGSLLLHVDPYGQRQARHQQPSRRAG
jgi:hypothetical protein